MAEDMRVNDHVSTTGSYSRRWLLKSSATVTAIAAAAVTLGPGIAGAESLTKTPSSAAATAAGTDYLEIGGI
jgi:tRNA A37 threonylcarbamoyltransferase TsaD